MVLGCGNETKAFSAHLALLGFATDSAEGEDRGLEMIGDGEYDLILVDAEYARAEDYRILKRIKASKNGSSIPVVVYTAGNDADPDDRYIEMGADDYLTGLSSPPMIRSGLRASLEKKSLQDKLKTCSTELAGLRRLSDDFTKVIVPIGLALSGEKDLDLLIEKILVEAKSVCNADAGTLYLLTDEDSLRFEIMHTDSLKIRMGGSSASKITIPPLKLHDPVTGEPNHHNVATHVALEATSINIPDIYNAEGFDFSGTKAFDIKNNYRSTSSLTVPLTDHDNKVIGVVQLLNARDPVSGAVRPFDSYNQQIVELLSSQAAMALSNQILMHREKKLLKFETDVQIGRRIQTDFLPDKLPQPPGCEVVSCFHPAREVSGDFYDAFMLPGTDHMGFVIADVCDKGVPAALFMAVIRSLIRAFSQQTMSFGLPILAEGRTTSSDSIEHKLTTLYQDLNALNTVVIANNYIARTHSQLNMFATLFLGVLDPDSGMLTYINGGHEAPVIIGRSGITDRLGQTGPAVGMMPDADFGLQQYQLKDQDILLAYTDGVPDARDSGGGFFTEKKLFSLLERSAPSAASLISGIEFSLIDHIAGADQFDDITMLAIRWSDPTTKGSLSH